MHAPSHNSHKFFICSDVIQITIKDSASKTHVYLFCGEKQLKLSRHLTRKHKKDKATVAEAMALKDGSTKAFERIRLRGDYHHNCHILALGEGEMIVVQNPATKHPSNASSFNRIQIAWVSLRGRSFGVTISDVNIKHPSLKNGRNCSLKLSFCC